ncbi:hypothetical protein [Deinococcus roseus]|uniref:DUF4139 domain-containing protein n=1 Tax=Deinococcus roseus TaxID=392414 RepID=A0ABQ2CY14_9DEIO|nr:hypothetical protein [Deinococcus roseus]GGJ31977.1 hypothetical protein GCM10008938_17690 [Deinococcus roseus]
MKKHILTLLVLSGAAQAADYRIYPTFSEVLEQVTPQNGQYTFTIDQNDLCQVFPSSIGLKNAEVESYLVTTRTVPWLSQLQGKRVAVKDSYGVHPAIVVRIEGQVLLVQDEVTKRYYTTTAASLEFFEAPSTFQDQTEVAYQFQLGQTDQPELHYLTGAVTWKPLYALEVEGDSATLRAWAEVSNQTAKTLKVDHADLFGGDVNRPAQKFPSCGGYAPQAYYNKAYDGLADMAAAPIVAQEAVSVPQATAGGIYKYEVSKVFEVPSRATYALPLQDADVPEVKRVLTHIQNFSYGNQKGLLDRVYRFEAPEFLLGGQFTVRDEDFFIGESVIAHAAKGKELSVQVGSAPEVTYDRTIQMLSQERVEVNNLDRIREVYLVTVVLKSFKDAPVNVEYQESMNALGRTWVVLEDQGKVVRENNFGYQGILQPEEEKTLQFKLQTERPY